MNPIQNRNRSRLPYFRQMTNRIVGRVVDCRHHLRLTPKIVLDCVALLIIGHVLTYVPAFIIKICPTWSKEKVDWFGSPFFEMKIERYWYFKNASDYLLALITYYILTKVANKFSTSLFLVCLIFLGYHVVDLFMFWWDFNGNFYVYIDILWTAIMLIKYALFPFKEERLAKIRSLF